MMAVNYCVVVLRSTLCLWLLLVNTAASSEESAISPHLKDNASSLGDDQQVAVYGSSPTYRFGKRDTRDVMRQRRSSSPSFRLGKRLGWSDEKAVESLQDSALFDTGLPSNRQMHDTAASDWSELPSSRLYEFDDLNSVFSPTFRLGKRHDHQHQNQHHLQHQEQEQQQLSNFEFGKRGVSPSFRLGKREGPTFRLGKRDDDITFRLGKRPLEPATPGDDEVVHMDFAKHPTHYVNVESELQEEQEMEKRSGSPSFRLGKRSKSPSFRIGKRNVS